jgi:phospholipase/carboxylesterase
MTKPRQDKLVIFLHGVGAKGEDLMPLGKVWARALPQTAFAAPDAPYPFDHGPGRQWFSISGITSANRPQRVQAARREFDLTITAIIAHHGLTNALHSVAFVGFSQGSIMALDAIVSGRWAVGAVIAFSGRLSTPEPWTPVKRSATLLVHGEDDGVIAASESTHAFHSLRELGISTECFILPGVGHTISPEGAAIAERFLVERVDFEPTKS